MAAIARLAGAIAGLLASLRFTILNLFPNLIIISIVATLLINYGRMMDWNQRFSPLPNEVDLLGLYLIANGKLVGGWVMILGYILIVSNMDTIRSLKLIPQNSSLVYVLALLACLGGLALLVIWM